MTPTRRRQCCHCSELYDPDSRNHYHHGYCGQPACRRAGKVAGRRRWRASSKGKDYFRGSANRQRVKAWGQAHPGYWRKRGQKSGASQDHCPPQALVPAGDKSILSPRALQDVILTQGMALTGLVAPLTGSALQENIASTTRRLVLLGRQMQGSSCRRPADGRDQEACPVPGATAPRAAAVQLDRPSPGPG